MDAMSLPETLSTLSSMSFPVHVEEVHHRQALTNALRALGLGAITVQGLGATEVLPAQGRKCERTKHCIVYKNGHMALAYNHDPEPGRGGAFWSGTDADSDSRNYGGPVDLIIPDLTFVEAHALQCAISASKAQFNLRRQPVGEEVTPREMALEIARARGMYRA